MFDNFFYKLILMILLLILGFQVTVREVGDRDFSLQLSVNTSRNGTTGRENRQRPRDVEREDEWEFEEDYGARHVRAYLRPAAH